jgi:hypothetical protein
VNEPKVLYGSVAPAALLRSEAGGKTSEEIKTLSQHPTRPKWYPDAEGLCSHRLWWAAPGAATGQCFGGIHREGTEMDALDPASLDFGTNTGKLFGSSDEGDSCPLIADNLPLVAQFRPRSLAVVALIYLA